MCGNVRKYERLTFEHWPKVVVQQVDLRCVCENVRKYERLTFEHWPKVVVQQVELRCVRKCDTLELYMQIQPVIISTIVREPAAGLRENNATGEKWKEHYKENDKKHTSHHINDEQAWVVAQRDKTRIYFGSSKRTMGRRRLQAYKEARHKLNIVDKKACAAISPLALD